MLALGEETLAGERRFLDQLAELKRPSSERRPITEMLAMYEAHRRSSSGEPSQLYEETTRPRPSGRDSAHRN